MGKVLVAYVTRTGSTAEVAAEVAKVLEARGHSVVTSPVASAPDPAGFDACVVGSPVNGFRWTEEALDFVKRHREALARRPAAFFLLSIMYGLGRPSARRKAGSFLDPALALVPGADRGFFGGVMGGPAPWPLRLAFGVARDAPLDSRDWSEIRSWAGAFADRLG